MRSTCIAAAAFLAACLAAAPALFADDPAPPAAKQPEPAKSDAAKNEATLRIERAKQLVKELEASIARVKAATPVDGTLLDSLIKALEQAKALAVPAKPAELTADEKKAVVDEAKKNEPQQKPND